MHILKISGLSIDRFTQAYIEAALWSETDGDGTPLDINYSPTDLSYDALQRMIADCRKFQLANEDEDATYDHPECSDEEMAGHDFWLTRNGHGAGFWDGDLPEATGKRLTASAKSFGECYLYVGDDGKIHVA